jgi:hypothetical protein
MLQKVQKTLIFVTSPKLKILITCLTLSKKNQKIQFNYFRFGKSKSPMKGQAFLGLDGCIIKAQGSTLKPSTGYNSKIKHFVLIFHKKFKFFLNFLVFRIFEFFKPTTFLKKFNFILNLKNLKI